MSDPLIHDTIVISKTINASVEQVFSAWEDPKARSQWGPPSDDEALEFLENDFRVGGRDVHQCGQKGDLRFQVETHYYHISRPHRLVFTERVSTHSALLSASLISVAIDDNEGAAKLEVTIQVASLVGADMIDGTRGGWRAAIEKLRKFSEGLA